MAVTRLKRKGLRNKGNSAKRTNSIKLLTATPVIKNVDVEALKQGFANNSGNTTAPADKKEEAANTTAE